MGWCGFGERRSPRLYAIKHLRAERQILNSSLLRLTVPKVQGFGLGFRLIQLSKALTLAILRLRHRMGGACWPHCKVIPVESGAWH